jgi:hypothetical protein
MRDPLRILVGAAEGWVDWTAAAVCITAETPDDGGDQEECASLPEALRRLGKDPRSSVPSPAAVVMSSITWRFAASPTIEK